MADVLFVLGNDDALGPLADELARFHYAPNLTAARAIVDGYPDDAWSSSFYGGWLAAIRGLNPSHRPDAAPRFTQTPQWAAKTMNTQLASWAQLKHDNLLYIQQAYATGGVGCEYPTSYVEPTPRMYEALAALARTMRDGLAAIAPEGSETAKRLQWYFQHLEDTCEALVAIIANQMAGERHTEEQAEFLKKMLFSVASGCATSYNGWYSRLFYTGETGLMKRDKVVADVFTQPTDKDGNAVGVVVHVGVGQVDTAFVVVESDGGGACAYVGPVMSYYERATTGFKRLTDDDWKESYLAEPSARPAFTASYLAGLQGGHREFGLYLPKK